MKNKIYILFLFLISGTFFSPALYAGEYIEIISATGEHTTYYLEVPPGTSGNSDSSGSGTGGTGTGSGTGGSSTSHTATFTGTGPTGPGIGGVNPTELIQNAVNEQNEISREVVSVELPSSVVSVEENTNELSDKILKNEEKIENEEKKIETKEKESDVKVKETTKVSNSAKDGDPVLVTKGEYYQNETDIFLEKNNVSINRIYRSGNSITGSFGKGFSSLLDERIIFYTGRDYSDLLKEYKYYLQELEKTYSDVENEMFSLWGINSSQAVSDELKKRKEELDSLEEKSKSSLQKISDLDKSFRIPDLVIKAKDLCEKVSDKKNEYEIAEKNVQETFVFLNLIEEKKALVQKEYDFYEKLQKENDAQRKENSMAIYSGTPEEWLCGSEGRIIYVDQENQITVFEKKESDLWEPEGEGKNKFVSLEKKSEGNYELSFRNGLLYNFSSSGLISEIIDRNQNKVEIERKDDEKVISIKTSFGEKYLVSYENGKVSKIQNARSTGEVFFYSYKGENLISVIDPEGDKVIFSYDDKNCLNKITKNDGSYISLSYGEQNANGDFLVTETRNEEGFSESFVYDQERRSTLYRNHDNEETYYEYDSSYRTIYKKNTNGTEVNYFYDNFGNLQKEVINGNTVEYMYDNFGRCIQKKYSDGTIEKYSYNSFGDIISFTDRDGVLFEIITDEKGNALGFKKGGIQYFSQSVNLQGLVTKQIKSGEPDIVSEYSYDINGNLVKFSEGNKTEEYLYDSQNRIISAKLNGKKNREYSYGLHMTTVEYETGLKEVYKFDKRKDLVRYEAIDKINNQSRIFEYVYDKRHLPLKFYFQKDGNLILYKQREYSPEGKIKKEILFEENGKEIRVIEYVYDKGNIAKKIEYDPSSPEEKICTEHKFTYGEGSSFIYTEKNENGNEWNFKYSVAGQLESVRDPENQIFNYNWTKAGRVKKYTGEFGGEYQFLYGSDGSLASFSEKGNKENYITYFPDGRFYEHVNTKGQKTKYEYNLNGDVSIVTGAGTKKFFVYDNQGRLEKTLTGKSQHESDVQYVTKYNWNDSNTYLKVIQGDGDNSFQKEYFYNPFGEVWKIRDGEGNETEFTYDELGRIKSKKDPYGKITQYFWNCQNLLTEIKYPDNSYYVFSYDYRGNCTKKSDISGTLWEGKYDSKGNLIYEKNRDKTVKKYKYDKLDRIIEVSNESKILKTFEYSNYGKIVRNKDATGNEFLYETDEFGRPVKEVNRKGDIQNYSYDSEGVLASLKDFNGNIINYLWTDEGSSKKESFSDGTFHEFEYDLGGNLVKAAGQNCCLEFVYDKAGLLRKCVETFSGESVSYVYDKAGQKIRLTGAGHDIFYKYGKNGEILNVEDKSLGLKLSFEYDSVMREISRKYGNGNIQKTIYNPDGTVSAIYTKNSNGEILSGEAYIYNSCGLKNGKVTLQGQVTLYGYNDEAQLEKVFYPITEESQNYFRIQAKENGIKTEVKEKIGYDIYDKYFLTHSQTEKFKTVLEKISPGLSSVLQTLQLCFTETYEYDLMGNRIHKKNNWGTWNYEYDEENRLNKIIVNNEVAVSYGYDKNGNLIREDSVNSNSRYTYNIQNRISSCIKQCFSEKTYQQTYYYYDPFGRRTTVEEASSGESLKRSFFYDGLSFDVLKESPVFENGIFTDFMRVGQNNISDTTSDEERYRYISDEYMFVNSILKTPDSFSIKTSGFCEELYNVYLDSHPVGMNYGGTNSYFLSDDLSSVKGITDEYGNLSFNYDYDIFGNLISENIPVWGYNCKRYDEIMNFYDYGCRHYIPDIGRFSSTDPVRYGDNWFAYVNGDPVNFQDLWGLDPKKVSKAPSYTGMPSEIRDMVEYKKLQETITYQKTNTKIVVRRDSALVDNNDIIRIYVDGVVYASYKCQSEKNYRSGDQTDENRWEPDLANYNATLPCGNDYKVLMMKESPSYDKPFHITSRTVKVNGASINDHGFMIHKWSKKTKEVNGAYSWGCQILNNSDFDSFRSELENIGFNNGDYIPLTIKMK